MKRIIFAMMILSSIAISQWSRGTGANANRVYLFRGTDSLLIENYIWNGSKLDTSHTQANVRTDWSNTYSAGTTQIFSATRQDTISSKTPSSVVVVNDSLKVNGTTRTNGIYSGFGDTAFVVLPSASRIGINRVPTFAGLEVNANSTFLASDSTSILMNGAGVRVFRKTNTTGNIYSFGNIAAGGYGNIGFVTSPSNLAYFSASSSVNLGIGSGGSTTDLYINTSKNFGIGTITNTTAKIEIVNGLFINALNIKNSRLADIAKIDSSGGMFKAGNDSTIGRGYFGSTLTTAGLLYVNDGTGTFVSSRKGSGVVNGFNIWIGTGGQSSSGDGVSALFGGYNTATGYNSMFNSTTAYYNSSYGFQSLYLATTASENASFGYTSMRGTTGKVTTATRNSAFGLASLNAIVGGGNNTAVGYSSLSSDTSGANNTAIGFRSFLTLASGSGNVGLGYYSGYYETGSNSFYINNQDRTNLIGDKTKSLLYGTFATTSASQLLTVNAKLIVGDTVSTTSQVKIVNGTGSTATNILELYNSRLTNGWKVDSSFNTSITGRLGIGTNSASGQNVLIKNTLLDGKLLTLQNFNSELGYIDSLNRYTFWSTTTTPFAGMIISGSDPNLTAQKVLRLGVPDYTGSNTVPHAVIVGTSNVSSSLNPPNQVYIGGGTGLAYTTQQINFHTTIDTQQVNSTPRMQIMKTGKINIGTITDTTAFVNIKNNAVNADIIKLYNSRLTNVAKIDSVGGMFKAGNDSTIGRGYFGSYISAKNVSTLDTIATTNLKMNNSGSAPTVGNATLIAGTVTVNTTAVKADSYVILTHKTSGGTLGVVDYTITAGTSFTITSNNVLDTSTYTWMIVRGY